MYTVVVEVNERLLPLQAKHSKHVGLAATHRVSILNTLSPLLNPLSFLLNPLSLLLNPLSLLLASFSSSSLQPSSPPANGRKRIPDEDYNMMVI